MEVYYQNEGFHQYMIVTSDIIQEDGYEVHMLMQFHGRFLLPVHLYGQNEKIRFQYDITGMIHLQQMTMERELDGVFLKRMISAIWDCCDELEEYLLSPDALLLEPQMIYYHPGRSQIYFGYLPGQTGEFGQSFLKLIEFCLKYTDHTDEAAVIYIYGLYRHVQNGSISREALQNDRNYSLPSARSLSVLESAQTGYGDVIYHSNIADKSMKDEYSVKDNEYNQKQEFSSITKNHEDIMKKRLSIIYIFATVVCVLGIIVFGVRFVRYGHLERDLKMIIITSVILLLCIYSILRNGFKRSTAKADSSGEKVQTRNALETVMKNSKGTQDSYEHGNPKEYRSSNENVNSTSYQVSNEHASPEELIGDRSYIRETSVLTYASKEAVLNHQISIQNCMWILKSMISEIPDISLYKLPGVFGRQQDCDYVLLSPGVSRRHAMIFESGQELYIEDLGSTNGTYIDHIRLVFGEPMHLKENSILQMGTDQYQIIRHSHS